MKTCIGRYDGADITRQMAMLISAFEPFSRRKIKSVYDLTIHDFHGDKERSQFDAFEEALAFCLDVMRLDFEYPDWSEKTVAALRKHVVTTLHRDHRSKTQHSGHVLRRQYCPDCGEAGELKGHMTCQYPEN